MNAGLQERQTAKIIKAERERHGKAYGICGWKLGKMLTAEFFGGKLLFTSVTLIDMRKSPPTEIIE